jgi:hypothetical protein
MSSQAAYYEIKITPVGVPPALYGVFLPVEIIPQEGEAQHLLLRLQNDYTNTAPVQSPGNYLIRTVLPSGQSIAKTAIVSQSLPPPGELLNEVTLDFGEYKTGAEIYQHTVIDKLEKPSFIYQIFDQVKDMFNTKQRGGVILETAWGTGESERRVADQKVSLTYGFFDQWRTQASNESLESSSDTVVITPFGKQVATLPGTFQLENHRGWEPDSTKWRPLLMYVRFSYRSTGAKNQEALIVYPPSNPPQELTLIPDGNPGANPSAPGLRVYANSGNQEVDTIFEYVRNADLHMARQLAPRMIERAQDILQGKVSNPVQATLAAYALLKVSNTERTDWVLNLTNWFNYLPDGPIIYAWYLIREGKAEQAHEFFRLALRRGLPMYSEGVRLLRDGLNFLRGLYPQDPEVQADAARANRLSGLANFDSDLTCLRLGNGLMVQFD